LIPITVGVMSMITEPASAAQRQRQVSTPPSSGPKSTAARRIINHWTRPTGRDIKTVNKAAAAAVAPSVAKRCKGC
jgi:hypothetical protein